MPSFTLSISRREAIFWITKRGGKLVFCFLVQVGAVTEVYKEKQVEIYVGGEGVKC